ncbi:MAG: hypothetical protein LC122_06965 [Chitinophagales bacterium]|nr:hypothetical protein [Chitinophagales bacterium]
MEKKTFKKSKLFSILLVGAFMFFASDTFAQASQTLKGEILDVSCYMTHEATGKGHKGCAQGCLNKGLPAGILNKADNQVYLLVEDHKKSDVYKEAIKHAAEIVEITGKIIKRNGMQSIVVESVKVVE